MAQVAGSCHSRRTPGWSSQLLAAAHLAPAFAGMEELSSERQLSLTGHFRMRFPGCPAEAGSSVLRGSPGMHSAITARWPWNK